MKCPDKDFMVEFRSMMGKDPERRWLVRLVFPARRGTGGSLPFYVTNWDDDPIPSGTFHLMGGQWPVADGLGTIPCAEFIAGIHETAVWFQFPGGETVPGGLTFG